MDMDTLQARLIRRANLFDDPRAYAAGVADALDAVARHLDDTSTDRTRDDAKQMAAHR